MDKEQRVDNNVRLVGKRSSWPLWALLLLVLLAALAYGITKYRDGELIKDSRDAVNGQSY